MSASESIRYTAPVSRYLAVGDVARTVAFYRDVLGFTDGPVEIPDGFPAERELRAGPVRLQIGTAPGDEPSPAVVFLEVRDVSARHAAVRAAGAAPSPIVRVNWLKYRMFEVKDPDGHALWIGETFQEPDRPAPPPMIRQALPELPVSDVAAAVRHYCDVLGFHRNHVQDDLAVLDRDRVTILLIRRTARHTGIGSSGFYVADADRLHAELVAKGANVVGAPVSLPWGLRQFQVLDPEGNRLSFSQTFE